MNFYAVRQSNTVPIGLFLAHDSGELASMVDPRTEPARCEYRIIDVPTCIMFDHPSHEVTWGMGIKEKDRPDPAIDWPEWEGWFEDRLETIQKSIGFDNDATDWSNKGTISDLLNGEKKITGWHKFSDRDLKVRDVIWGYRRETKPRKKGRTTNASTDF